MASKRKVTRRGSNKGRKDKYLVYLLHTAKVEVKKLIRRRKAGTISDAQLKRKLKRVAARLKRVLDYTSRTLDEVSKLLQRDQVRGIGKVQMNLGLRKVEKRLELLVNFSDFRDDF